MKYKNAVAVLPTELIEEIQKYIQGEFLYIPKKDKRTHRAVTEYKVELEKRVRSLYEQGRKKDPEVFKDDIKLDKHKIYTVVNYLQDINLSKTDLDSKGLAFQKFMFFHFQVEKPYCFE